MDDAAVVRHIANRLPFLGSVTRVKKLTQGLINHVWRVFTDEKNVIVKWASTSASAAPDLVMDRSRIVHEANALKLFQDGAKLANIATLECQTPQIIDFDKTAFVLTTEDVGAHRLSLDKWLADEKAAKTCSFRHLGRFVGGLHQKTTGSKILASTMNNLPIQQTRLNRQYATIEEACHRAGLKSARQIGQKVQSFGKDLLKPGLCLTMGDLWPRSILVDDNNLRIIDWEFAHFGRPAQDIGHFFAHLWLLELAIVSSMPVFSPLAIAGRAERIKMLRLIKDDFLAGYSEFRVLADKDLEESFIHFGAEILTRTIGAWRKGYLFETLHNQPDMISRVLATAADAILQPDKNTFFK